MFAINDEIVHDVFGPGKILDIKSNEFCKVYKIMFLNSTEFVVSYDNLLMTKIENEENDIVIYPPLSGPVNTIKNYDLYILIFIVFFIFIISSLLIEYLI